jgi:hypothetical protein
VARQGREHAILGVRAGLGVDRVVTDDGNPIHAQDKRKARAKLLEEPSADLQRG